MIQILGPASPEDQYPVGTVLDEEVVWVAPDPNFGGELRFHAKGRKTTLPLPKGDGVFLMRFPKEG